MSDEMSDVSKYYKGLGDLTMRAADIRHGAPASAGTHDSGGVLDFHLPPPNWEALRRGLRRMAQAYADNMRAVARAMSSFGKMMRSVANDEDYVFSLRARYYVRGGGAPWSTEAEASAVAQDLLRRPGRQADDHGERILMGLLTHRNRALLAAAALEGYVRHHEGPAPEVLAWHRYIGGVRVSVGRTS